MNFAFLRPSLLTGLALSIGLNVATASASPTDLQQKLSDAASRDPFAKRQVSQFFALIERGQFDQVVQTTVQQFFQVAPGGALSEDAMELWHRRAVAKARSRFLGQYLGYDLDGDGGISRVEIEGLTGNDAAQVISLLGTSDVNDDGEISAQELRQMATDRVSKQHSLHQMSYLMAFDLDRNGIVGIQELLDGLRMLAEELSTEPEPRTEVSTTAGTFVVPADEPDGFVENPKNADGLPIELHMVGIYEPRKSRNDDGILVMEPVSIKVDRPGVSVALVLGSYRPTRWAIETTEGTQVEQVIMGDRNRQRGEVLLNGEQVSVTFRDLPLAYQSQGIRFQPFHKVASDAAFVRNAESFQGSYKAPVGGFFIDGAPGVPTKAEVDAALTAAALPASELSETLRSAFEGKTTAPGSKWALRDEGFVGVDENGGAVLHKLPLEAPDVSWPMGAAYDPKGQQIWGVTLGGEGYVYRYDISKNQWSVRSMDGVDAGGLIFDPETGTLVSTPGSHGGSGYLRMDKSGKLLSKLETSLSDYPGLINTFDPGNGPRPRMVPVMIDGDLLLVRAEPLRMSPKNSGSQWSYLVNLQSGAVRLVR